MSNSGDIYTLAECVADYKHHQHYADYYKDSHWHLSRTHRKEQVKCRTYVRMLRALTSTKVSAKGPNHFEILFDLMGDTDWDTELSAAEALMGIER